MDSLESYSAPQPPSDRGSAGSLLTDTIGRRGVAMFQRIGWLRPSAAEWRLWLVQGAVVLAAVALIGTVMFLILR